MQDYCCTQFAATPPHRYITYHAHPTLTLPEAGLGHVLYPSHHYSARKQASHLLHSCEDIGDAQGSPRSLAGAAVKALMPPPGKVKHSLPAPRAQANDNTSTPSDTERDTCSGAAPGATWLQVPMNNIMVFGSSTGDHGESYGC